ncbi:MAG: hypothetical protein SF052_00810 [Bacteroidia bacterium]|nr:hypothetical protein [Bacteroidia bacterium]
MNQFLEDWNKELDDLEVQISLGKDEVAEAFEKQKAAFTEFVNESKNKISALASAETAQKLKGKLESLQVQLALGKAETREAYEEQKNNLEEAIREAKEEYEEFMSSFGEKKQELSGDLSAQFEKFRTKMDLFRLQFALGTADAKDDLQEKKKELQETLSSLRAKIEVKKETAEETWEEFSEEVSETYDYFKDAVKKLFS